MFNTYEELKEKFPIGIVYRTVEGGYKRYYYNLNDVRLYNTMYDSVIVTGQDTCLCISKIEYKVEGYLFDGTYWYPAKRTWDGWETIDEDEVDVGGFNLLD